MRITTFITTIALTLSVFGQDMQEPWEGSSSTPQFFMGAGYSFASEGSSDILSNDTPDGLGVDQLYSVEFGLKKNWEQFTLSFSAELIFGEGSDSGIDSFGDQVSYDNRNFGGLLNLRGEFRPTQYISLYAGGGIGSLENTFKYSDSSFGSIEITQSIFIWQGIAGIEINPVEQFGVFVQYRYLAGEELDNANFTAIDDSFVDVGARFYF